MVEKKVVVPGDKLYTIEEFLTGSGTYAYDDGWIRSSLVGVPTIDMVQRVVVVKNVKSRPCYPKPGDIVVGVIESLSEDIAFINIFLIETKFSRSTSFTGILHVSQASDKFIKSMYEAYRLGDVVRAKILNDKNPFQLSTRDPQFGVIAALCSKCGEVLKRKSDETLVCPRCGCVESRKVSIKYVVR